MLNTIKSRNFGGHSSLMTNPDRLQKALDLHSSTQQDWQKLISCMRTRKKDESLTVKFTNDPSRTRLANLSPIESSLMERSSEFKYDNYGTKKIPNIGLPHICENYKKPRIDYDF